MKKPLGIKLIIALNLLGGIIALIIAIIMISNLIDLNDPMFVLISMIPITILVLIYTFAAYGLWTYKTWGASFSKWIYLLASFVSLIILIKPFLTQDTIEVTDIFDNILGFLISIAIVRYLSRKSIKEFYK